MFTSVSACLELSGQEWFVCPGVYFAASFNSVFMSLKFLKQLLGAQCLLMKFAGDTNLWRWVNMLEGRAAIQGVQTHWRNGPMATFCISTRQKQSTALGMKQSCSSPGWEEQPRGLVAAEPGPAIWLAAVTAWTILQRPDSTSSELIPCSQNLLDHA